MRWLAGYWGGSCNVPAHVEAGRHPGVHGGCVYDKVFYPMQVNADGSVSFVGIVTEDGDDVVSTYYDELLISMADARRIAAVPDLIAACRAMQSCECGIA